MSVSLISHRLVSFRPSVSHLASRTLSIALFTHLSLFLWPMASFNTLKVDPLIFANKVRAPTRFFYFVFWKTQWIYINKIAHGIRSVMNRQNNTKCIKIRMGTYEIHGLLIPDVGLRVRDQLTKKVNFYACNRPFWTD